MNIVSHDMMWATQLQFPYKRGQLVKLHLVEEKIKEKVVLMAAFLVLCPVR